MMTEAKLCQKRERRRLRRLETRPAAGSLTAYGRILQKQEKLRQHQTRAQRKVWEAGQKMEAFHHNSFWDKAKSKIKQLFRRRIP